MTGNHEGLLRALGDKAFLQYAKKNPFAKKKVLEVFLSRRSCIFLTQEVEREGVKGEKTKSCHVET